MGDRDMNDHGMNARGVNNRETNDGEMNHEMNDSPADSIEQPIDTMATVLWIPGIIFLFLALLLSILVTISVPPIHRFDITRVHFFDGLGSITNQPPDFSGEFRFGLWGYCFTIDTSAGFHCVTTGNGYSVTFVNQARVSETVGSSWTRGLAVHVVACIVTAIAFVLSFSERATERLVCSVFSLFATLFTLAAYACDIALLGWVRHQTDQLNISQSTYPGQAFWMTLVILIVLILATVTSCLGYQTVRKEGGDGGHRRRVPWQRSEKTGKPPPAV
ncbi:hypothetical protein DACRYDRAFT_106446 [Dacryopinax primogenitus]|uniref:Pali-domain-containing protein n=1 Tax=Dacryopinax primogenitus (strain DJM 731) TaxID=1858805 RepID=M5GB77_DACPD|nr:uncharacterized protein DACRYDRAFT_106446 [Dacryopinax primogenitus]EJU03282.1 hypothetical protein DACRYDRAFT_106446 [Dacryopinax primogenitus]